jgi:hypothetical protein
VAIGLQNIMTGYAGAVTTAMGGDVTYTPSGGEAITIKGMFQTPYNEPAETDTKFSSQEFILICQTSDVSTIAQGDAFSIESVAYTVDNAELMQMGLTRIRLSKD